VPLSACEDNLGKPWRSLHMSFAVMVAGLLILATGVGSLVL
jgi:hypothetical protein